MDKLLEQLNCYVYLRMKLKLELQNSLTDDIDSILLNVPKSGCVNLDGKQWNYKKHGVGVCFQELSNNRKIDIPKLFIDENQFDSWSVLEYLRSLGRKQLKNILSGEYSNVELERCWEEFIANSLQHRLVIQLDNGLYQLNTPDLI